MGSNDFRVPRPHTSAAYAARTSARCASLKMFAAALQNRASLKTRLSKRVCSRHPKAAAIKAGRLLMAEIRQSLRRKQTFALESTLSGKTYLRMFNDALKTGY